MPPGSDVRLRKAQLLVVFSALGERGERYPDNQ